LNLAGAFRHARAISDRPRGILNMELLKDQQMRAITG
jgi:hypothetical protein